MTKYLDNANSLLSHARQHLSKILQAYQQSLNEKNIEPTLLIDVKNLMENLRSALDYLINGVYEKYGNITKKPDRLYFPYSNPGVSEVDFEKRFRKSFPDVADNSPEVLKAFKSFQYFGNSVSNNWLNKLMALTNDNKHVELTPQEKVEIKQRIIESDNGFKMVFIGGGRLQLGKNARVQFGKNYLPGGQTIDVNNPANITGNATQTVKTWVSFNFASNGEPVIPFLTTCVAGVDRIIQTISTI